MKTFTSVATLAAMVAGVLAQGQLTIQTPPSVTQCQPSQLQFTGGQGPYFLSILPGGQVSAAPIETLPQQAEAGAFTWNVDVPAGTQVTLQLKDSSGAIAYSSPIDIQPGDDGCVSHSAGGAGASSGGSSGASSGGSSGGSSASASSSGGSSSSGSSAGPTSSGAGASSSGSSGAPAATSAGSDDGSGATGLSVGFSGVALAAAGALLRAFF